METSKPISVFLKAMDRRYRMMMACRKTQKGAAGGVARPAFQWLGEFHNMVL
jgi:hypothetical protein